MSQPIKKPRLPGPILPSDQYDLSELLHFDGSEPEFRHGREIYSGNPHGNVQTLALRITEFNVHLATRGKFP
jgi:hypothetical protein